MNKYSVVYSARRHGAIGIFYPVRVVVEAANEVDAKELGFNLLQEKYETQYCSSITKLTNIESMVAGEIKELA